MNFLFSLHSLVRYCSCHLNIKFISSPHRAISSIYWPCVRPRYGKLTSWVGFSWFCLCGARWSWGPLINSAVQDTMHVVSKAFKSCHQIHRGYYTVARRYEFYVRVARTISHSFAALTCEILFLPLEHKIHIFEPPCNVLFLYGD